jgi:hypothetical protein
LLLVLTSRCTRAASRNEPGPQISKDRATPDSKKYLCFSMIYMRIRQTTEPRQAQLFLPGGKICRSRHSKQVRLIASREYGLY